ncbi:hypothetical protein [Amycolatopsis thermoflava]|uniref:hypothetical protein n=1 Tax=Amycolatopsis thermoflava TaxID=84480 RepID=UPI003F4A4446
MSTVPIADQQSREPPPAAGFMGTKGALMCAQPRNPDQTNDDCADVPAPADQEQQGSPVNAPNRQPRRRVGAGRAVRNVVVRGVRRDPPDMRKLARVVASLAADLAQAEASEQTLPAEPSIADASRPDHRRDAA